MPQSSHPKVSHIALLLILLLAPSAGAITGGVADGDEHPYVGAIRGFFPDGTPGPVCTGALISSEVVLTAGHCLDFLAGVFGFAPTDLRVTFAADWSAPGTVWIDVAAGFVHPEYVARRMNPEHDLAALVLAEPVVGIAPVALAPPGFLDQAAAAGLFQTVPGEGRPRFVRVGYGISVAFPPPVFSPVDGVRRQTESEYQGLMPEQVVVNSNQAAGNGGFCAGDSGGPGLWIDPATGSEVIVGVTSWGDGCIGHDHLYRVDLASSAAFIDAVLDCASGSGCTP